VCSAAVQVYYAEGSGPSKPSLRSCLGYAYAIADIISSVTVICVGLAPVSEWAYISVNIFLLLFDISFLEAEDAFISSPLFLFHAYASPIYVLTIASPEEILVLSFPRQVVYLKFTELTKNNK
jgi:hypothetical protein